MIIIRTLKDMQKYLTVSDGETIEYNFNFYTNNKLDDILFASDFLLDSFTLLKNEQNLDKVVNTVVKIKANSIKGYNLSCDYVYANKIMCNNLQITYNIECVSVNTGSLESLSVKAKEITVHKLTSNFIECEILKCDTADFYQLISKKIFAKTLNGVKIDCPSVKCEKINYK